MINTAFILTPLVTALVVGPPAPSLNAVATTAEVAEVAEAAEAPAKIHIHIDVSEVEEDARGFEGLVLKVLTAAFSDAGFELVGDASGADVALLVRFEVLRANRFDYGIHFEFVEGDSAEAAVKWIACMTCVDVNLRAALADMHPKVIAATERRLAGGDPRGVASGTPSVEADPLPVQPIKPAKPIGPLGYAGVGVAALGIGAAIVGAVELSRGKVYDRGPGFYETTGVDHTPPGYALLGVGGTVAIAGLVMLGVDLGRRAKQRKQGRLQESHITPSISPFGASIGFSGKF